PYLRRYARALTGSQSSGDAYVRATLLALLAGKSELSADVPPRVALYRLFHVIWSSAADQTEDTKIDDTSPESPLGALPPQHAKALLLTAVEGFSLPETAQILGESVEDVEQMIVDTQREIEQQLASRVLIIEDESIIALDLTNLVTQLGHEVVASAATHKDAVALAHQHSPGLILA